MDLRRTFPTDPFFKKSSTLKAMKNILLAYSRRNVSIGYCQGFNFIIGRVFKIILNEENSFWLFVQIIENILPLSYYSELAGILVDTTILHTILKTSHKSLHEHMCKIGYNYSINNLLYKWFVSLFIQNTNSELSLLVWDSLFLEGSSILFYASLAMFSMMQTEIFKANAIEELHVLFDDEIDKFDNKEMMMYYCIIKPKNIDINDNFLNENRRLYEQEVANNIFKGNQKRIEMLKLAKRQASYVKGMVICQKDWPMCIYDLTYKYNNIIDHLVLRVGEKINLIDNYFFNECYKKPFRSKSIDCEKDLLSYKFKHDGRKEGTLINVLNLSRINQEKSYDSGGYVDSNYKSNDMRKKSGNYNSYNCLEIKSDVKKRKSNFSNNSENDTNCNDKEEYEVDVIDLISQLYDSFNDVEEDIAKKNNNNDIKEINDIQTDNKSCVQSILKNKIIKLIKINQTIAFANNNLRSSIKIDLHDMNKSIDHVDIDDVESNKHIDINLLNEYQDSLNDVITYLNLTQESISKIKLLLKVKRENIENTKENVIHINNKMTYIKPNKPIDNLDNKENEENSNCNDITEDNINKKKNNSHYISSHTNLLSNRCISKSPKKINWNQGNKQAMKFKAYTNLLIERRNHICDEQIEEEDEDTDIIKKIQREETIKKRAITLVHGVKKLMTTKPQKEVFVNYANQLQNKNIDDDYFAQSLMKDTKSMLLEE